MKFKINEIFSSLQGEGTFVGVPMNFIRFTRCDLKCKWCDTDFKKGKEMTIGEILKKLNSKMPWVSLTGGEPMMEENLLSLIKKLKERGYRIFLETNGTKFDEEVFSNSDFISNDLKAPSSGNSIFDDRAMRYALENQKKTQLKVVIQNQSDLAFFREIYKENENYDNWILQPEWSSRNKVNYGKMMNLFPKVRVIPQVHRILNLR